MDFFIALLMLVLRSRWVLPITSAPMNDGWVAVEDGRIVGVGSGSAPVPGGGHEIDLGRAALLPALVNAHTHLELSYLAGRVPPVARFTDWIREVMRQRREHPDPADPEITSAQGAAIERMQRGGVGIVGDISNTLVSVDALGRAGLSAAVFHEVLRFRDAEAAAALEQARLRMASAAPGPTVRVYLALHAPYSVSRRLFALVGRERARAALPPTSVHVAESPDELELLGTGGGPLRALLEELGTWDDAWTIPGVRPVEYLVEVGCLDARTLVVHGVQLSDGELARVAACGATLVTCPRSNVHVGVGAPPIARFYESGAAVAVGTDSLASAPDLAVFPELAAMRRLAPHVPARRLLDSATRVGARALGFIDWGTIEPGARAALIAVEVPADVPDVEEYLVSGIEDGCVRPLDSLGTPA